MRTNQLNIDNLFKLSFPNIKDERHKNVIVKLINRNVPITPLINITLGSDDWSFLSLNSHIFYKEPDLLYKITPFFNKDYDYITLKSILSILMCRNEHYLECINKDLLSLDDIDFLGKVCDYYGKEIPYVDKYLGKCFNYEQFNIIYKGLIQDFDVDSFAKPEYNTYLMSCILKGYEIDKDFNLLNYIDINYWINYYNGSNISECYYTSDDLRNKLLLYYGQYKNISTSIYYNVCNKTTDYLVDDNVQLSAISLINNGINLDDILDSLYSSTLNKIIIAILAMPLSRFKIIYKYLYDLLYSHIYFDKTTNKYEIAITKSNELPLSRYLYEANFLLSTRSSPPLISVDSKENHGLLKEYIYKLFNEKLNFIDKK